LQAGSRSLLASPSAAPTVTLKAVAYALYVLAGLNVFAVMGRFAMIGKPRKPSTRGDAFVTLVYCGTVATILVIAAMRLG
jgi:hypothetical protein